MIWEYVIASQRHNAKLHGNATRDRPFCGEMVPGPAEIPARCPSHRSGIQRNVYRSVEVGLQEGYKEEEEL